MSILKLFFAFMISAFFMVNIQAQSRIIDLGVELQAYPTGLLPGVRATVGLNAHHALHIRAGYNIVRHRDLGIQDNEEGGGFGFTLGYEYYFGPNLNSWFLGARTDLWFNSVDWKNDIGTPFETSGTTDLVVLQPTLIGGYLFELGNGNWVIAPTLAFGFEINVVEDGAETGEGPIGLIGFNFLYRFGKNDTE